jgi:hypothetical protein
MDNIIRFDHFPGHRHSLIKMRILKASETQISIEKLVERTLDQDKLNRVLDVLKNELVNQKSLLDTTNGSLNEVKQAIEIISDQETLQAAAAMVDAVEHTINGSEQQAILVMECLREFEAQMTRRPRRLSGQLSDMAMEHVQIIITLAPQIFKETMEKKNTIKRVRAIIEERGRNIEP